jgi:sucrose phosphorylase
VNRESAGEPSALQVDRFIATRSIPLVLRGVPGVYLPSLFGARNDTQTALASRDNRSINRTTIQVEPLVTLLSDRSSWVRQVATRIRRLLKRRVARPAFHPNASQQVLDLGAAVFAVMRCAADESDRVLALTNVSAAAVDVTVALSATGVAEPRWRDVLSRRLVVAADARLSLTLRPYDVVWLVPDPASDDAPRRVDEGVIEL